MTDPTPSTKESSGGGLTSKIGPLPMWGWVAIAAAGGIAALLWMQHRKPAAQPTNTTEVQGPDSATVANLQDQLGTVLGQIRDLQGGSSKPAPGAPTDTNTYLFKIPNDPLGGIYAGIPGVGWYWIPTPEILNDLKAAKKTVYLGQIDTATANARFGSLKPWSNFGQATTTTTAGTS
jgi:hypothetical protein